MAILIGITLTVFIITCLFLILLVMIQTGKGGNLFGAATSQSAFGSSTGDVLSRATRITAILFLFLALLLSWLFAKREDKLVPETSETEMLEPARDSKEPAAPSPGEEAPDATPLPPAQSTN